MIYVKLDWKLPCVSGEEDENSKKKSWQQHHQAKLWMEKISWTFGSGELNGCHIWENVMIRAFALNKDGCMFMSPNHIGYVFKTKFDAPKCNNPEWMLNHNQ